MAFKNQLIESFQLGSGVWDRLELLETNPTCFALGSFSQAARFVLFATAARARIVATDFLIPVADRFNGL